MEAIDKCKAETKLLWIILKCIFKRLDGRGRSRLIWRRTRISCGLLWMVLKVQVSYTMGNFLVN